MVSPSMTNQLCCTIVPFTLMLVRPMLYQMQANQWPDSPKKHTLCKNANELSVSSAAEKEAY